MFSTVFITVENYSYQRCVPRAIGDPYVLSWCRHGDSFFKKNVGVYREKEKVPGWICTAKLVPWSGEPTQGGLISLSPHCLPREPVLC